MLIGSQSLRGVFYSIVFEQKKKKYLYCRSEDNHFRLPF